ncbi:aryl-alcohol dehydrogenase [Actinocorallia herbida]|uniref:Aryl-alcohol dehydrogenase n=1 Tax=Actinocorallia herbida TaxID=58109 RepID=A0A3N1CNY3_9ACTN|nr:NAD(P)-dependent alcohol dehydrogenase [Actinocorallia herbida]ROO83020.1 aryl-alcohol dehydrogenase [Actinocorallia herbida]
MTYTVEAAFPTSPEGRFERRPVELREPGPEEVLVRLVASGVCHTDLVTAAHPVVPGQILGHEGAGVVEAVGDAVSGVEAGDHVVLSYSWCGACPACENGRMAYCADFLRLNYLGERLLGQGSFATFTVTTERNVIRVPDDLPLELLAPLGCGVQTGAGAVLNVLRPEPGSSLAVFALGAVGLSAVMAARIAGCERIVAVDPNPSRRALALELGATEAVDPSEAPFNAMDHAVECIGYPDVVRAAVKSLAAPGQCVTVGFQGQKNPVELDQRHLMNGRGIRGSIEGDAIPQRFIPELIEHHRKGRLPLERLITTFAFADIDAAVTAAKTGKAIKPVLIF